MVFIIYFSKVFEGVCRKRENQIKEFKNKEEK